MSLNKFPEPWRPNAIYQIGNQVTIRGERCVYVLRCESPGKGGLRPPNTLVTRFAESHRETAVVKLYDAECEWWLEGGSPANVQGFVGEERCRPSGNRIRTIG